MRILVIDDDALVAGSIKRRLALHRVEIETDAPGAYDRVGRAANEGDPFELVLCDLNMPGMDGVRVFAALRSLREPPMLVLMSGCDSIVDAPGADAVLLKPFRLADVHEAIAHVRAQRARTATVVFPRMQRPSEYQIAQ